VHEDPALDGIDPGLRPLVERALAKDPADRPSAAELLRTLLGGADAPAAPRAELIEEADDTVRRSWPGAAPEGLSPAPPPPAPRPDARPRRRRRRGPRVLAAVVVVALAGAGGYLGGPRALDWLRANRGGAPTETTEPENQPPWAGGAIGRDAVPEVALAEYDKSGMGPDCPLMTFADLGEAAGAIPRRADFGEGQWATAWDSQGFPGVEASGVPCPDCGRGALGIASVLDPGDPIVDDEGASTSMAFDDGSTVAIFDGDPVTEDNDGIQRYAATVRMPGNVCVYSLWSYLSLEHLEFLITNLRTVET
jgi:hypothetical protein